MRIKNWLKQDLAEIKRIAAFIKGVNHRGIVAKIKNSRHAYAGTCWYGKRLVVVRINPSLYPVANWYGTKYKRLAKEGKVILQNWQEGLLFVLAHELRHVYQHANGKPASEVDAERFAIKQLKRWREQPCPSITL